MKEKNTHEPVRLRTKKMKSGGESLYLDIYHEGKRQYEFLKLYLVPENNRRDREMNRNTLAFAEAIRAKRIVDLRNGDYGFKSRISSKIDFFEYYQSVMDRHGDKTREVWNCCLVYLRLYEKNDIRLSQIKKEWITGFVSFLSKQRLSKNSQSLYFDKLRACINAAFTDGFLDKNPLIGIPIIPKNNVERNFLTVPELRILARTPMKEKHDVVRRAFLFSCLTGLRWSDINKLSWDEVKEHGGFTRIVFRQKKTSSLEYLDLTPQAVSLMGSPSSGPVFSLMHLFNANQILSRWVKSAGISKHITFHCARHTFAIMMLDLGTDIYTVSKLLGHSNITTTQIYAKVLDKNKQAAVAKIPSIL